jgi:hypothetical protein
MSGAGRAWATGAPRGGTVRQLAAVTQAAITALAKAAP